MRYYLKILASIIMVQLLPSSAFSREMICKYDYIVFEAVQHIIEQKSGDILINQVLQQSTKGGEDFPYLGDGASRNSSLLKISDYLFIEPTGADYTGSVVLVDFEKAEMRSVQFLERHMRNMSDYLPVNAWSCVRID